MSFTFQEREEEQRETSSNRGELLRLLEEVYREEAYKKRQGYQQELLKKIESERSTYMPEKYERIYQLIATTLYWPLIIMAGLPATGKTTIAKALQRGLPEQYWIHSRGIDQNQESMPLHELFSGKSLLERTELYLRFSKSVIVDDIHATKKERQELYKIAAQTKNGVIVMECVCSEGTARERMNSRGDRKMYHGAMTRFHRDAARWEKIDIENEGKPDLVQIDHLVCDTDAGTIQPVMLHHGMENYLEIFQSALR